MTANGSPAPDVRLGATADDGIAASIFALVERGAARRPELAREMRGRIELCFEEGLAPVRLGFEEGVVVVEDGAWDTPDLRISGRLAHVVALTVAPLVGGVPNAAAFTGRKAGCAENYMTVMDFLADPVAPVRARRQSPVATRCARSTSRRTPKPAPPLRA